MIRVGLEISTLFHTRNITGIPRVVCELAKHAPADVALSFFAGDHVVPDSLAKRLLSHPGEGPDLDAWLKQTKRALVDSQRLHHAVFPLWRLPRKLAAFETSILCDLTPVLFPQFHRQTGMDYFFPKLVLGPLPYSDRVVCISDATRRDLLAHTSHADVVVAHLGVDHLPANADLTRPFDERGNRRYLMVGSVEPRKNVPLALEWFFRSHMVSDGDELRIAGGNGWGVSFEDEVARLRVYNPQRRVTRITQLDDPLLYDEYTKAFCLLYPSTYEGFGLPPLEAMNFGTPSIVANSSSLPEVCGAAGVYLETLAEWEAFDLALTELEQRTQDSHFRSSLRMHSAGFRWKSFAQTVLTPGSGAH